MLAGKDAVKKLVVSDRETFVERLLKIHRSRTIPRESNVVRSNRQSSIAWHHRSIICCSAAEITISAARIRFDIT